MLEHRRQLLLFIVTLGLNLPHQCYIRLIQQVLLEEHIGVPLEGVSGVERETFVEGHN